ncbi:ABC transporter substrate-binding protein [Achromobacter sp. DMS1]|uniref:ABC transporter substrate-binding protein n=1 Tax=Achromobacter sp. DMS1 TaxID=1688405 RepID=UPI00069EDF63|nr:ABC transporter substrate-binding protein [Achromobacter sp. DMS1]KOF53174.1 ABC transporter substrate-binding protein [Achromobacter sp. DMS1]
MQDKNLTRRGFIKTASGLALAPAVGWLPAMALAADKQIVVGTWGGDYQNLLQQIINPLVAKAGVNVVYDTGNAVGRVTKLRAEKNSRRGSMDVALLGEVDMYDAERSGTLERVDAKKVPNLAHAIEALKTPYSIPHIFSAMTLVYNTEKFAAPPDSLQVLLDPKWKGQVGFSDILYLYNAVFVGLGANGTTKDFEGGKRFLSKLKANAPRIYPSNEAVAAAFKSGEISIACMWKARALQWKDSGLPLGFAIPKEGSVPVSFEAAVAKNSRNKDASWAYLNAMLEPEGQVGFARKMGYAPTVANATLPDDLKRVGFTDAEVKLLHGYDLKGLTEAKADILEFWNKDFKAGL